MGKKKNTVAKETKVDNTEEVLNTVPFEQVAEEIAASVEEESVDEVITPQEEVVEEVPTVEEEVKEQKKEETLKIEKEVIAKVFEENKKKVENRVDNSFGYLWNGQEIDW